MGKKNKKSNPFGRATVMAVITWVREIGSYAGYRVVKNKGKYNEDFDNQLHIVTRIIDGDTIEVDDGIRVRLVGIDAPEEKECYAKESEQYLTRLLMGREVRLDKDIEAVDVNDRLLRYVVIPSSDPERDEVFVNLKMLEEGMARTLWIAPNGKYRQLFNQTAHKAEMEEKGLWKVCSKPKKASRKLREKDSQAPGPEYTIKGNISEKGYGMRSYGPECPNYKRIKVDPRKGERWFRSYDEAEAAGFPKSESCGNTFGS